MLADLLGYRVAPMLMMVSVVKATKTRFAPTPRPALIQADLQAATAVS
jgi:hypothetical protein